MSKSIIIFGKGPSLERCTKEFVDKYDDIAICNYPYVNELFNSFIKDKKIKYHFANCGTFDERYTDQMNTLLKIEGIYNTNKKSAIKYKQFLNNKMIFKENIREAQVEYFKQFNLDPNTGTMALQYILDTNLYNKIALVGFDNFKKGDQKYYYQPKHYNNKIFYLINQNVVTKKGIYNQISLHSPIQTKKYYEHVFSHYSNIQFNCISNINFDLDYNNVSIN